jgi:gliding motility-associated-like protein
VKHKFTTANTYQVTQIVTNTYGCKDTLKKNVIVYPIPIINAGRDTSICNLDTITLQSFGGAIYSWSPNFAMDDSTSQFPIVTPDRTTNYFVTVITSDGCTAVDSVLITNVNPPSDGIIKDTTICYGDTIQLKAPVSAGNLYVWSPSTGLNNVTISNPLVNIFQKTIYQIYIRNGNCIRFDTAIINVKVLATPDAGIDETICNNLSTTLHATHGTYFNWSPTTNMLYSNTSSPVVSPKITTTYYVTVVDTAVCLKPETDSMIVFVDHFKYGEVQNDTNLVKNIPSTLYAHGGSQYLWQPSTGLDDSTSATPTCTVQHDQVYIVKIADGNGCYNYDTLKVYVFPAPTVLMPNAFSPNGDGLDDVIMPVYAGIRTLNHFNIYNRWGQLVFTTTEINQGWDGTLHGVIQPLDTYIYMLDGVDVEGNGFNYKGDITLIK